MAGDPLEALEGTARWYAAVGHPRGQSDDPLFEVAGSIVYPSTGNPSGPSAIPWYQVRGRLVYAVDGHPDGASAAPVFGMRGRWVFPLPWIEDVTTEWFRVRDERQ